LEVNMTDLISEADYWNALAAGDRRSRREPRALAVAYDAGRDAIVITMAEGWRIDIDRARIAELAALPPAVLAHLSLSPAGTAIELEAQDVQIGLAGLLATLIPVKTVARRAPRQNERTRAVERNPSH
jgi:hypothetical protein